jgi:hypothetical protein
VLKHFPYISYGYGMHYLWGLSLNHDIPSSSLRLRSQVYPNILKIHPLPAQAYTVRVDPYAHPQHVKVLKHFSYISYGCGIHFTGGLSPNHGITSSLRLRSTTPKSPKSTPALHWRNTVRVTAFQGSETLCIHK